MPGVVDRRPGHRPVLYVAGGTGLRHITSRTGLDGAPAPDFRTGWAGWPVHNGTSGLSRASSSWIVSGDAQGVGALLLGSTSYRTAGRSPCPVAVVRGDLDQAAPAAVERIVVGVDGSRAASRALRWALEEAELREVPVTVVHGYAERAFHVHAGLQSDAGLEHARKVTREHAAEVIDDALQAYEGDTRVPVDRVTSTDSPAGLLLEQAGPDALLVVGARGHGAVTQMLLGSVTHQCLHHATGPVVVVP